MASWVWQVAGVRQAVEFATRAHEGQVRRGSGEHYINHPLRVAQIVERQGFREPTVIAALFHDLLEDTLVTLNDIGCKFDPGITPIVVQCSEIKVDPEGRPIPWEERKQAHLARLRAKARIEVRAIILADKLDNLRSIRGDLDQGRAVWELFHAPRDRVLWYYDSMVATCDCDHRQVHWLADQCRGELELIRAIDAKKRPFGSVEG